MSNTDDAKDQVYVKAERFVNAYRRTTIVQSENKSERYYATYRSELEALMAAVAELETQESG